MKCGVSSGISLISKVTTWNRPAARAPRQLIAVTIQISAIVDSAICCPSAGTKRLRKLTAATASVNANRPDSSRPVVSVPKTTAAPAKSVLPAKSVPRVKSVLPASHVQKTKYLFILFLKAIRESEWLFFGLPYMAIN